MLDMPQARARPAVQSALIYTALVMTLSAPFWVLAARQGVRATPAVFALMWCPAVAGFAAAWLSRRRWRAFGWRWPGFGFLAAGYGIPVVYALAAYGAVWAFRFGRPDTLHYFTVTHRAFWQTLPLLAVAAVFGNCLAALGEEIGWRGFLVPVLAERFGLAGTALVSGAVWTAWHVPLILFGDYNGGTPAWYSLSCFTALVMAIAFLFAWLRLASGSLWPCVVLHAVHNTVVQAVLTPLTADTGHTAWYIDEFGIFLPVAAIVATIVAVRAVPVRRGWGTFGT